MECRQVRDDLTAYADGELAGEVRLAVEAHVETCAECAALLADLAAIRRAARALPELPAPRGAWDRLARTLPADAVARPAGRWWSRAALPLAAAALLVVATAITIVQRERSGPADTAAPATASELLGSVEAELRQAELHYENAIRTLETLARDRTLLDPQVAADLQKSLQVIDQAIGESRAALEQQPASEQAQASLFEAFRTKIALLQDTIALINEMRKGNQAEVARIADGPSKS